VRGLISRGIVDIAAMQKLFAAEPVISGSRCAEVLFILGKDASLLDAVMGLKDALAALERKPPGKLLVIAAPELLEDVALAAFAAAKSLARETAMPANCVNAMWLKPGKLPGWRAPVDLWKEAAALVPAVFSLESTSGQVFVIGPSPTAIPL
jgi:hypothetical protein